jgi:TfoX/Sxy family transcriptional regulator of competence genes
MGYDKTLAERVRQILSTRQDVVEKPMIGGLSFMVGGAICCGITSAAVMVRVGPEAYDWALAQPNVRPMAFANKPLAGYVLIDPAGCETEAALATWIERGLDFVATLPAKTPTTRKQRPKN